MTATIKKWRQRLGYCSVFAAVPAILAANLPQTHSAEAKKPEAKVAGRGARLVDKKNNGISNLSLLQRQSKFLLPHQRGNFAMAAALAGNDDCPGRAILGGNYTAAAPYIDSGDTTGANSTVGSLSSYYYYNYDASGPDHVYSFTLTGLGPNPQIEVSTTSGTYKPWYFQFVASWDLAEKQKRVEIHWLSYEDLIHDKPASVLKVLEFYGLGAPRRGVEQRIKEIESEERKIRFNKGVTGRGRSGLNDRQKEQIRRLTRFYPSTDFSRIGL